MQLISNIQTNLSVLLSPTPREEQLKQNLNQFGLNPANWTLNFHQKNYALITNTDENDFQFIGKMNETKTNWEFIKLFNL
jgi:hypothetical protein